MVFGLASADHILAQYPLLTTGGAPGGATGGATGGAHDVVEEYAVAPTDQLRVKIEERHYDLSRFVDLHPGGALMVANGEDLTTRFKEAHGDDRNLFDRDEITQVTEEGHRLAEKDKTQVKEHRTAN